MSRPRITLRIDRVTVEGRPPSRETLAEAIRAELQTLLEARNDAGAGFQARTLSHAVSEPIRGAVNAGSIGRAVARAAAGVLAP